MPCTTNKNFRIHSHLIHDDQFRGTYIYSVHSRNLYSVADHECVISSPCDRQARVVLTPVSGGRISRHNGGYNCGLVWGPPHTRPAWTIFAGRRTALQQVGCRIFSQLVFDKQNSGSSSFTYPKWPLEPHIMETSISTISNRMTSG
jgi:hypothetical protein